MAQNEGNIGLHFYRGYFKDYFGNEEILKKSKQVEVTPKIKADIQEEINGKNKEFGKYTDLSLNKLFRVPQVPPVTLKTVYPGLYTGSGYTFGVGAQGEFQLGFLFDHTTGLPYIPGSSVKGAVRAAFPTLDGGKLVRNTTKQHKESCINFIWQEIISKVLKKGNKYHTENLAANSKPDEVIKSIELEIFEGRKIVEEEAKRNKESKSDAKEIYLSVYERDIFHDAFIEDTVKSGETKDKFLGTDYITPHPNPLKNPIPLPFLKILPGVKICFQFSVRNGYYLTAKGKEFLFKEIIKAFGIGAKTNVGYGQFSEE